MATKVQRAKTILDALADATTPNATLTRVADAFAETFAPGETLTNEQKAAIFLAQIRLKIREIVHRVEITQIMEATRVAGEPSTVIDLGVDA